MDSDEDLQPAKKPKDGGDSDSSIEIEGIYIEGAVFAHYLTDYSKTRILFSKWYYI